MILGGQSAISGLDSLLDIGGSYSLCGLHNDNRRKKAIMNTTERILFIVVSVGHGHSWPAVNPLC